MYGRRYYPGTGIVDGGGYVVGAGYPRVIGDGGEVLAVRPLLQIPAQGQPQAAIQSPPWRGMMAPGNPPLGEGHVPMPMNPETFNGTWGTGGAAAGARITFSARPQKPFKMTRLLVRGTKSGATAIGALIGQLFVGTDLQQGELGDLDLETLGAGGAFDTWVSMKQAEPGVWIRAFTTLTAFPTAPDFETYTVTAVGHYLH